MAIVENSKIREIQTYQFGKISIEPQYIFNFKDGIFGFEELKEFVLIADEETAPIKWLISIDSPEIGFPLLNPWLVDPSYSPNKNFHFENEAILVVVTLGNGIISANMKAPLILNIDVQKGRQIILPSDKYSTSFEVKTNK